MRIDHVSLTVRDVDRSIEFYSKGLGLRLLRVSVLHPSREMEFRNAYMYSDSFLLELITAESSAVQQPSPESMQKAMRGSIGITHLGMRVRYLEVAIEKLKVAGGIMIGEPFEVAKERTKIVYVADKVDPKVRYARRPGKKPWRIALFRDPDGVVIELVER